MRRIRAWYLWMFNPNQWLAEKAMRIITQQWRSDAFELLEQVESTLLLEGGR